MDEIFEFQFDIVSEIIFATLESFVFVGLQKILDGPFMRCRPIVCYICQDYRLERLFVLFNKLFPTNKIDVDSFDGVSLSEKIQLCVEIKLVCQVESCPFVY